MTRLDARTGSPLRRRQKRIKGTQARHRKSSMASKSLSKKSGYARLFGNVVRHFWYYSKVGTLYGLTVLFAMYLARPNIFAKPINLAIPPAPTPTRTVISGKPSRLVINSLKIDKPINEGHYNTSTHTWTLSGGNIYFAMPTAWPNDFTGNTLIYGHYNLKAFYHLKNLSPGSLVDVHTDNGHVFTYQYYGAEDLKPNDVSVFRYQGPPRLTIQTCSGSFYEQRRLFYFSLIHLDGHAV